MIRIVTISCMVLSLQGCGAALQRLGLGQRSEQAQAAPSDPFLPGGAAVTAPATAAPPPPPAARTAEALDTTTPEQRAAALRPAASGARLLGTTVASLGSPTEPGLWLKTPLVTTEAQGRVTNPATGKSSAVTLLPIAGEATAGSRMSLAALRLIGASLTDPTPVEVSVGG